MDFSAPYALDAYFGNIDIYLFDQLLKGRIRKGQRILDAGCGNGRNLVFMLRQGFDVYGVDLNEGAIAQFPPLLKELGVSLSEDHFRVEAVEALSFPDGFFDLVISSAVLHFAQNETHFDQMMCEMWRVLKAGGIFFARMTSNIGLEARIHPLGNGQYHLPDGSTRFLLTEAMVGHYMERLGAQWIEPLKTVNVAHQRCMTTWCIKKEG